MTMKGFMEDKDLKQLLDVIHNKDKEIIRLQSNLAEILILFREMQEKIIVIMGRELSS